VIFAGLSSDLRVFRTTSPCGPFPAPRYALIEDGGDEKIEFLILPIAKRWELRAPEGPRESVETNTITLADWNMKSCFQPFGIAKPED